MCNFLEYKGWLSVWWGRHGGAHVISGDPDSKVVYRRYASLFFVAGIGQQDNELITLEIIHRCAPLHPPISQFHQSAN